MRKVEIQGNNIKGVFSNGDSVHLKKTLDLVKKYKIGGLIFSKGLGQTDWLNRFQKKSKIPLLIGMDAEWGVAMRLDDVLPFPWNMTLGAVNDNDLIYDIGKRIGEQSLRLGINMNFAPVLDVNTNPKNSIIGNSLFKLGHYFSDKKMIAERMEEKVFDVWQAFSRTWRYIKRFT